MQKKLNWLAPVSAPQRVSPLPSSQLTVTCLVVGPTLCYPRSTPEIGYLSTHTLGTLSCPDFCRDHPIRCNTRTTRQEVASQPEAAAQTAGTQGGGWSPGLPASWLNRASPAGGSDCARGSGTPATYLDRVDPAHVHVTVGHHEGLDGARRVGR